MSWSGFKKNLNRAGTSLMQKAGAMEKTVDKEFEEEERRFKNLENKAEKLQKEAKGYLDSLRAMTAAQSRIAETIDQFYDDASQGALVGTRYKNVVERLEKDCRTHLEEPFIKTVIEPLNRFTAYFPDINEAIKRRQKKMLDYDAMRAKVQKLINKPSDDTTKLPRAEQQANEAREVYETLNNQLLSELPKLIDLRVPYFDPSFEALVKIQLKFCQESYEKLAGLREFFPNEKQVENKVEAVLQQMKDLSIVGLS